MADIRFRCRNCGQKIVIETQAAGMCIECPNCSQQITIKVTKRQTHSRARLVHWIEDAAMVAERGGSTFITETRNGLEKTGELNDGKEIAVLTDALRWLNSRLEANYDAHAKNSPEAVPRPDPRLAKSLAKLAVALRERWAITDEMLSDWKPRTWNVRQQRENERSQYLKSHPNALPTEFPVTARQREYMEFLGLPVPDELTKEKACAILDKLHQQQYYQDRYKAYCATKRGQSPDAMADLWNAPLPVTRKDFGSTGAS